MTEPGLIGRRLPDGPRSELPDTIQPGDYWKILDEDGKPALVDDEPTNLTGTEWHVAVPGRGGLPWSLAWLRKHTVREHEDGTITVAPNDGSSNSILVSDARGGWHGYIDRGHLYEV